jgi:hypothetical protein
MTEVVSVISMLTLLVVGIGFSLSTYLDSVRSREKDDKKEIESLIPTIVRRMQRNSPNDDAANLILTATDNLLFTLFPKDEKKRIKYRLYTQAKVEEKVYSYR